MFGLVLDIMGACLVSVEAIKLDNLRTLRTKILGPLHTATLSPTIEFIEGRIVSSASRRFMWFYNGLHYLAGALLLVTVNCMLSGHLLKWAASATNWLFAKPWYVILSLGLVSLAYGIFFGLWMSGSFAPGVI